MNDETICGVENLIRRRIQGLESLNISWFGGEPLMASKIVLRISELAKRLSEKNGKKFFADMTTNGFLLTPTLINSLVKWGVTNYQITLDGDKTWHNKSRKAITGKSTFDTIWKNLLYFKKTDLPVRIQLRIHYTPESIKVLPNFIDKICTEFLSDSRFHVFFHQIIPLGGPNDKNIKTLNHSEIEEYLVPLRKKIRILNPEGDPKPPDVCYAARPNSLVVRADGRIGKCTVILNDKRNTIGKINPDGTLDIKSSKLQRWIRGVETLDAGDLICPAKNLPF